MASAVLLSAVTGDTVPANGSSFSGPCTVYVTGSLGQGEVVIEIAVADTAALFNKGLVRIVDDNTAYRPTPVNAQGAYYIRASLRGATGTAACTVTAVN